MISQYNITSPDQGYGIKNLREVVSRRLKMQGFVVGDPDMGPAHAVDHQKNVQKWSKYAPYRIADQDILSRACDSTSWNQLHFGRRADFLAVHDGTFITKQSITKGIDNGVDGLLGMLKGENFGKAILTIAELDEKVGLRNIVQRDPEKLTSKARSAETGAIEHAQIAVLDVAMLHPSSDKELSC